MKLGFTARGWDDYVYLQTHEPKLAARVNDLIKDIRRSPFRGIGKPEPLRDTLAGSCSRRINEEHRLVYRLTGSGDEQQVEITQCRLHYSR